MFVLWTMPAVVNDQPRSSSMAGSTGPKAKRAIPIPEATPALSTTIVRVGERSIERS